MRSSLFRMHVLPLHNSGFPHTRMCAFTDLLLATDNIHAAISVFSVISIGSTAFLDQRFHGLVYISARETPAHSNSITCHMGTARASS